MESTPVMEPSQPRPPFFRLSCQEPFRIFIPLGVLIGISGVSLWPLYFSGLHKFYPGVMHSRMMIEGFMTCFVIGFLGTAAPRLTGTPHFSRGELISLLALLVGAVGMHIAERYVIGDSIFLALLLVFAARLGWRFSRRAELPPPSFALVAFGFLGAIIGVALLLVGVAGEGFPRCALLGSLLLYQGFLLELVLGVGGFLLPRFLTLPSRPELPETSEMTAEWKRRAYFASGIGAVLLASFVIEVFAESPRIAGGIRFLAVAIFLLAEIPLHHSAAQPVTFARSLRLALVFLLLGLLFPVLWPWQRLAGEHLIFIGGFTLITFAVATRVVLGHSGHIVIGHSPPASLREAVRAGDFVILQSMVALLVVAAVLRAVGDFFPAIRGTLLSVASYLWMLAAGVWSWRVLPKTRISGSET
jgi:uncharacterized protein involved in response to NO